MSLTIEKTKFECGSARASGARWQQGISSKGTKPESYWGAPRSTAIRNDASLVPPIRQTASIFKQPVTVYKSGSGGMVQEPSKATVTTTGGGDKPKQLIWEKRLEGLRACDASGEPLGAMELPRGLRPVLGPVSEGTVVQSVATALHVCPGAVTGQTGPRAALDKNPGVYLDPRQPLVHHISITDEDIHRQEERVCAARRKLQEALNV